MDDLRREKLKIAVRLLGRYVLQEEKYEGGCDEADCLQRNALREIAGELMGIDDADVEAIALRLLVEGSYHKCVDAISRLVSRGHNALDW